MILRNASLFSQLLSLINRHDFARLVKTTHAEKGQGNEGNGSVSKT